MRSVWWVLGLAIVLLAGCASPPPGDQSPASGTSKPTSETSSPASSPNSSTPPPSRTPTQEEVHLHGFVFSPGSLNLTVGSTVTWRNFDSATHSSTLRPAGTQQVLNDATLAQGQATSFTFSTAGEFEAYCRFHPSMTSTVSVS